MVQPRPAAIAMGRASASSPGLPARTVTVRRAGMVTLGWAGMDA